MTSQGRPDVAAVLAGLKDFQQLTVEYVFDRLYGVDPTRRFLLADEVGLGKTLVAKGVIARAIDHLWDTVDRIDVIYICSNADIARQNLTRLHPERDGFTLPSRITLLPLKVRELQTRKLNFVSFTPGTSLEPRSAMGTAEERALLYWLLRRTWAFGARKGPLKVLQGAVRTLESFESSVDAIDERVIDETLASDFVSAVEGRPDLRERFEAVLTRYQSTRDPSRLEQEVKDERRDLIGDLRQLLARTCIQALQPDLVLLDEFQRFKHLLTAEDDAGELARELFDWQDAQASARVLLMSATPYKMYTLNGEESDDHYREFVSTLEFLAGTDRAAHIGGLLKRFRRELLRAQAPNNGAVLELRDEIERELRRVIVRTERLGTTADRDGMLRTPPSPVGRMTTDDVQDYLAIQRAARVVGEPDMIEYWKSSPYLLNLMGDDYTFGREFKRALSSASQQKELAEALESARLLHAADVERWDRIDPANGRLRGLIDDTVGRGAWKLLWLPPSLPYHEHDGPYADPALQGMTKRLVFSSWHVVPRAIASLVSYAAEREMWAASEPAASNTQDVRDARGGRLAFAFVSERLTGMPVLAMLFPSTVLSTLCDPLVLVRNHPTTELPSLDAVQAAACAALQPLIGELTAGAADDGPEDPAWYWATPLLLDARFGGDEARGWLDRADAVAAWSGYGDHDGRWADHVVRAQEAAASHFSLGRPPADLADVVARIGLAGWGNVALRALSRVAVPGADPNGIRAGAAHIAWALRSLFNLPEVSALVRGMYAGVYWQQCLSYSLGGGLQAVLDEYAHLLVESLGHAEGDDAALAGIAARMADALTIRAARISTDEVVIEGDAIEVVADPIRFRARFATRFGEDQSADEGVAVTRPDTVRAAFNSPFWPFVLASTSVGQEGLDFHHYCHAVVHWNLPPNPVDLEQREGRVHRYKNHAVRKNLALRYARTELPASAGDPWAELFAAGHRDRPEHENDLVPYWLYPLPEGASIERHVPALPLSREIERFALLRRSLAVYRMAFGQSRQEDLVAYLLDRFSEGEVAELLDKLKIDLQPRLVDVVA